MRLAFQRSLHTRGGGGGGRGKQDGKGVRIVGLDHNHNHDIKYSKTFIIMICDPKEQEARSPQIDLTLPNCDDYAALGYKVLPI